MPRILLTRPLDQSQRFARSLRNGTDAPLHITISPLMQVEYLSPSLPGPAPAGLIFTSRAGVEAYLRLPHPPSAPAWCVGKQTAKAALSAGLLPQLVAQDAAGLLSAMVALRPSGPFLHVRGADSIGNIAPALTAAGIPATDAVVYVQRAIPLSLGAQRLLATSQPVVVPFFSARSALLFCAAAGQRPGLWIAAFSPAVAAAIPAQYAARVAISPAPEARAMRLTVLSLLSAPAAA
jgi:uroporphyrinogen-III synthase